MNFFAEGKNKECLNRIEDLKNQVKRKHTTEVTDFLDPQSNFLAQELLKRDMDIKFSVFGGYKGAERVRIIIYPEYMWEDKERYRISLLHFKGSMVFKDIGHRDFLGAILGKGIRREKIGDIVVEDDGCVVAIDSDLLDLFLIEELKIKNISFKMEELGEKDWEPSLDEGSFIDVFLASLRLDAIVSQGFNLSRSAALDEIKKGMVKVNWQEYKQADYLCSEEDTISVRGYGRLVLKEILGISKKGKQKVTLQRFR